MPRIHFTSHLRRQIACPENEHFSGATVQEALAVVFEQYPQLRGYVLDDQGKVRQHVAIFVDNGPLQDRERLSDPVQEDSDIFVLQALSGG